MDHPKLMPGELYRRAIFNQYNAILLGGAGLFSLASSSVLPMAVATGLEVLWLVLGADSGPFRRYVAAQKALEAERARAEIIKGLMAKLEPVYRTRFEQLCSTSDEIRRLARENKGFATTLLRDEMAKLGQLLESFGHMAVVHQRLFSYLRATSIEQMRTDIASCERSLSVEQDPRVQASLKQALSLAQKRVRQHTQIEGSYKALSVQMVTMEKAFDYLKSNILGIGTGEELSRELDGLVSGVSTVAELESYSTNLDDETGSPFSPAMQAPASQLKSVAPRAPQAANAVGVSKGR